MNWVHRRIRCDSRARRQNTSDCPTIEPATIGDGGNMQFGYFTMPSHPPERPLKDGHEWDLQVIRWLDELGFSECWIGEHHTAPWEPHPSPDLLVAQGLMQTKNIRLGPGGFLDLKSTRLNSSHLGISYAVFCLKKKK